MSLITPKPLLEVELPKLNQVGAFSLHASASSLREEGGERQGVLQFDEQETDGDRA